jgi:hypothetical protein
MNTRELRLYESSLEMTCRQREMLNGMLLGDAHLERQKGARAARLKIEHSVAQAEYVCWKYSEWQSWVRTPPKERKRENRLGTSSVNVGFTTLAHDELEAVRVKFYVSGRKIVPVDLQLTPLAVAVWFMDDGSRKSRECRGVYFNTQSFMPEDVERLRGMLLRDAGIQTSVRQQRDGLQIYVPSSFVGNLVSTIGAEVLPCMRYKLPG